MKPQKLAYLLGSVLFVVWLLGLGITPWIYKNGQGTSPQGELNPPGEWYSITAEPSSGFDSKGYDFFFVLDFRRVFHGENHSQTHTSGKENFAFLLEAEKSLLQVSQNKMPIAKLELSSLFDLLTGLPGMSTGKSLSFPQSKLTLETPDHRIRLYIENLSALRSSTGWKIYFLKAFVLVRISS